MTDHPRNATHQPVPGLSQQVSVNDAIAVPSIAGSAPPLLTNGTSVDEEGSFTIKCICNYLEDDGFTILCESCNTWQHADCYYEPENIPGENDVHSCVDCDPRILDARRANEIQQSKIADIDAGDRKLKKAVKSQKKKIKPIDSLATWPEKHELGSPRNGMSKEQKKMKSGHKHSISMHAGHASAPKLVSRRSLSHTVQSPSKGSDNADLTGEPYSEDFMLLYDDDPGESTMKANLFNNIAVTSRLARWSDDVDDLAVATNGKKHPEVFLRTDLLETVPRPELQKHTKEDTSREFHGRHPKWKYLTTTSSLLRESFVGELVGKIGLMTDYVQDESNRWEYLRHPLPFVFFHPILPIYIDTRNEGSLLRYLRRSCDPNLGLKTFLENGSDYKFGFVATKNIEAGMELTIPWTTDEHVRAYTQQNYAGIKSEGQSETVENYILNYFSRVFADFGGCACESPEECAINKLARRLRAVSGDYSTSNGKKKVRKSKEQGPGRTNNSRSGSEAMRYKEDDEDDDAQSTSTSSHSKPQSRDMTPHDPKSTGLLDEMTEREKRKLAAAVERFDQDKNQPQAKKKKRTSGTSNNIHATLSTASSVNTSSDRLQKESTSRPSPLDTGLVRKNSGSPTYKTTFSMPELPRKPLTTMRSPTVNLPTQPPLDYTTSAMQTEGDGEDRPARSNPEQPRRKFVSLKKQLLVRTHQTKGSGETTPKSESLTPNGLASIDSEDTAMAWSTDNGNESNLAPNIQSTSVSPFSGPSPAIEKQRPPDSPADQMQAIQPESIPQTLPGTLQNGLPSAPKVNGFRQPDFQIPLPPTLTTNGIPPNSATTVQSPLAQSPSLVVTQPFGSLTSPSPIKKKLSLGDYISRKGSSLAKPDTLAPTTSKEKDIDSPTSVLAAPASDETGDRVPAFSTISDNGPEPMAIDAPTVQPADTMEVDTSS